MVRPARRRTSPTSFSPEGKTTTEKGAGQLVFAEVEEVNSFCADLDLEYFSRYAFGFADVLAGFVDGDAVGGKQWRSRQKQQFDQGFRCAASFHPSIVGRLQRAVCTGRKKCAGASRNGTGQAARGHLGHALSSHCRDCPPGRQAGVAAAVTTILLVPLGGAFGSGGAKATTGRASGPTTVQLTT